jgi:cytochrome bd ubiquinol oxidase subunit II
VAEWPLVELTAAAMVIAMAAYILFGGADFGGGVWDLFARGPRAARQRALIADTIGPIWEANHVWLILVVVILFTGFPIAYARLSTALHIPLTLMLIGIVLRGSAFTFRAYDSRADDVQQRWSRLFAISSLVTPVLLGIAAGTVVAGGAAQPGVRSFRAAYVAPWTAPLPILIGLMTLLIFAFLAAVYLTVEATEDDLAEDFRRRAIASGVVLTLLALGTLWVARTDAPRLWEGLLLRAETRLIHAATALSSFGAFGALLGRRYRTARTFAALMAALIILGWALAQYPYLVPPDLTVHEAAAPPITLALLVGALGLGGVILFPALWYLYRVFGQREG